MPSVLQTYPEYPRHEQEVELGGRIYRVRLTWRRRPHGGSWYLDMLTADGQEVVIARRLSPQYGPLFGLTRPGAPEGGVLLVRGPAGYGRFQLGRELLLFWADDDELPEPTGRSGASTSDRSAGYSLDDQLKRIEGV